MDQRFERIWTWPLLALLSLLLLQDYHFVAVVVFLYECILGMDGLP